MNMFQVIILIIILSIFTTIHEVGHFVCARMFRKSISEFCIGCGPVIYRKGIFVLRLIPFLGYNMMEIDINADDRKELKENFFILISGYIATSILAIFIYPFSKILSLGFLISIIGDYISSSTSDGKRAIRTLCIIYERSK